MKKLFKLSINPEKLIQIDELKILRGGDYDDNCIYTCRLPDGYEGKACGISLQAVTAICILAWGSCECW